MTSYAYDCEFLEDGRTIELISIGIVCEDGREYYAVNADMPIKRIRENDWLLRNVMPSLPITGRASLDRYIAHGRNVYPRPSINFVGVDKTSALVKPKWVIANEVREFLLAGTEIELWADYAAYDHVALAQLWGRMINLPKGVPMYTNDLQQALRNAPDGFVAPTQAEGQHNALADARHVLTVLDALRNTDRIDIVADGRVIRSEAA